LLPEGWTHSLSRRRRGRLFAAYVLGCAALRSNPAAAPGAPVEVLRAATSGVTVVGVTEQSEIHARAVAHARLADPGFFRAEYVLFRSRHDGTYHGSATCAGGTPRPTAFSVDELLSLPIPEDECECGGWRSTDFFPALLVAYRSLELHRLVEAGGIESYGEAVEQLERMQPWWRPDLVAMGAPLSAAARLAEENQRVELGLLDEFASRFDPSQLHAHLAALGMWTSCNVSEAREFISWVERLDPQVPYIAAAPGGPVHGALARRARVRTRFDGELLRLLEGPSSLVLLERRLASPEDGATWRMPAEVLVLGLTQGNLARSSVAWLLLPDASVAGLRVLLAEVPGPPRLGVLAGATLPSEEVRSVAEVLWSENASTWRDLGEVLAAASALAVGR
jgi:hypothetical protein